MVFKSFSPFNVDDKLSLLDRWYQYISGQLSVFGIIPVATN